MTEISNIAQHHDPNVVKVVTDREGFALFFSRSLIPFPRKEEHFKAYKHIGIYVFKKDFLLKFAKLPQTILEKTECLEQLRVLENGFKIKIIETNYESFAVDKPTDLEVVREIMKRTKT